MENEKLLNTNEVASLLRVPKATILQYTHKRILNYYKIGRHNLYKEADVIAFIESRRKPVIS
jgi:excisionase family DNA binding protein